MIGSRIGPYSIVSELGSGGMGKVYLAEVAGHVPGLDDGARVALKVIHPHLLETPGFFKRFLREAEIGKSVEQDNVVRCFDCDAIRQAGEDCHFLVMEYVEGQTLRGLLNELERVPEELCRHIGREIAKGLAAIHEAGVIHRDLKPENVLITEDHVVKVMDLGVARLQDEVVRLAQTGAFVGSLEYACPEQFRSGGEEVDARSDLHALGVMLYELATGQHPYRDEDASRVLRNILDVMPRKAGEVNPQLSPFYEEVVFDLLAKKPEDRFTDASTLAVVLDEGEQSEWWKERAKALRIETKKPLRRIRIPRETALYGRDDDLQKLHALFDRAKEGDGQVLLVEGEAGIGKTRLVDEFVGRLRQDGEDINFLFGSYPPGGAATAAGAFSTAYREQFGPAGSKDYLTETPILVPAFDALLRGEPPPKGEEPLTKDSLQTVFVHATRGLAAERTTIVLIDDLHFAPEEGPALFASLGLACPGHRILLVGTMRPGVPEDWIANVERLDHAGRTVLSRLGPKDLIRLLKDSFRSERLARELGVQIAEKSDGNPFFAFEIIRGLREGQFISQQPDGTWVTTKVIEDIQVPSSVLDLVNARIADLSEEERDLLDVAACFGFEFEAGLVADAVGVARIPALKRFGQIERRHRLVRTAGRKCVFDHHQIQEALYGSLMPELREEYHAAIGEALEKRSEAADKDPRELDGALCVDLCEHFLKGARGERGLRYLDAALSHLEAGYLNDQLLSLADRVLEAPGLLAGAARLEVLVRKDERLDLLGRREAQRDVLEQARLIAAETGEKVLIAKVERALGILQMRIGDREQARIHFERLLTIAQEAADKKSEAAAELNLGGLLLSVGHHAEAQEHFERCLALALAAGDRYYEAAATAMTGAALLQGYRLEEAVGHLERSIAKAHALGRTDSEAASTINLGSVLLSLERPVEAQAAYKRGLRLAIACGNRMWEANASVNLGVALLGLGRLAGAKEHVERYQAIAREIEDRDGEAASLATLGQIWLSLGQVSCARVAVEDSLTRCRALGSRDRVRYALRVLGLVAQEEGDRRSASLHFNETLSLDREAGDEPGAADSLVLLGVLLWRSGEADGACETLREAVESLRPQGRKGQLAHALAALANLPGGDATEAEAALQEAGEAGNTPQTRYYLWKATGKHEHLAEAKSLLDYRVKHAPEEYRESMLKNVRLNREIMEAWEKHGGEGE